jgi:hypothetical protein
VRIRSSLPARLGAGPAVVDRHRVVQQDWASLVAGPRDAVLLLMLAIGCTLLPFALSLVALRRECVLGAVGAEPRTRLCDRARDRAAR